MTENLRVHHQARRVMQRSGMGVEFEAGYYVSLAGLYDIVDRDRFRFATQAEAEAAIPAAAEFLAKRAQAAAERRAQQAAKQAETDAVFAAATAPAPTAPALATERQVDYIMTLIARGAHEEGGFLSGPTTRQDVATLTRREASTYIDSLTGRY